MNTRQNPPLLPGDIIAIAAPASIAPKSQVKKIKTYFQKQKIHVVFNKETYTPLSAKKRAKILLNYLLDPKVKLIWTLRGGEGCADLIPFLRKHHAKLKKIKPKIIIGFSDITALLIYFSQTYHWPVIHGTGARQLILNCVNKKTKQSILDCLFKNKPGKFNDLKPLNMAAKKIKTIEAKIIGGNLSLINISIKDCWEIKPQHKILFLEDINETPYAVLRVLKYFQRIDLFKDIRALVFGEFICKLAKNKISMQKALEVFAKDCKFPVLQTYLIGHGKNNLPIPFNQKFLIERIKNNNRIKMETLK